MFRFGPSRETALFRPLSGGRSRTHLGNLDLQPEVDFRHQAVEAGIGGTTVTTAIDGRQRVPIQVRLNRAAREDIEKLGEILVMSPAGFDAHVEDDMAMLQLRDADYRWVTEQVKAVAVRHAKGRIVSLLEGGYDLSPLARSVEAHIRVLADL